MTTNQTRALSLARAVSDGRLTSTTISDDDWTLLLLAAGMNHAASTPAVVSRLVLESATAQTGYFWPGDGAISEPVVPRSLLARAAVLPAAAA